jgi:uncharacterized SAM-binding protein YcdF (DUF218 family)
MFDQSTQIRFGRYLILVLLQLFIVNHVYAQELKQNIIPPADQYVVNNIIANANGKTSSQARFDAINSGQRNAFIILLGRLGVNEKIGNNFDNTKIADMVLSQQIVNEKISKNGYSATLNLKFSESFVKYYLDKNITSIEGQSSFLVVPIKLTSSKPLIWEDNNDWKVSIDNVINNLAKDNTSYFLKTAQGDIADITIIAPHNVNNIAFADTESILNRYGVGGLMLIYFDFDSLENKVNITMQIVKRFTTNSTKLEFINVNQLNQEDLLNKVAKKTIDYAIINNIQQRAKSKTMMQGASLHKIDVLVSNLGDWLKIKNQLENSNIVSQFKVESISSNVIKINASYNNKNGDIIDFFAKNNLFLQKKDSERYILSLTKN